MFFGRMRILYKQLDYELQLTFTDGLQLEFSTILFFLLLPDIIVNAYTRLLAVQCVKFLPTALIYLTG